MIEFQDLPRRSPDGLAALDVFYEEFNDIHFYVEDEDQENLYEVIFGKLFPNISFARIFPLGGKEKVLAHAAAANGCSSNVCSVYLVDKDFDDFLEKKVNIDNVYYLDWFCIENYLIEEKSIIELVIESHPKSDRNEIRTELKISEFLVNAYENSRDLFAMYFFVQKYSIGVKNTSSAPESYCKVKAPWDVCNTKLIAYRALVDAEATKSGIDPLAQELSSDHRISNVLVAGAPNAVSGKHVAARLFHYIKSKYPLGSITFDSFVYRLAKNCSLDTLQYLSDSVQNKMNTQ
jgi:hypothetical protein